MANDPRDPLLHMASETMSSLRRHRQMRRKRCHGSLCRSIGFCDVLCRSIGFCDVSINQMIKTLKLHSRYAYGTSRLRDKGCVQSQGLHWQGWRTGFFDLLDFMRSYVITMSYFRNASLSALQLICVSRRSGKQISLV